VTNCANTVCWPLRDGACVCVFVPGTGCNAAYVEKVDNVDKWTGPKDGSPTVRILFCIIY